MAKLYGLWITEGTIHYFVNAPEQALPQHLCAARNSFANPTPGMSLEKGGVAIQFCFDYESVAKWVVLKDNTTNTIFATKWTPESPIALEVNHLGNKIYKVLDFAVDEMEANSIVSILKGDY